MKIKYPLIIPSIGHGSTDLLDLPYETLRYNLISCLIVYNLNYNLRKIILLLSSIIHIADDFNIKNNNKFLFSSIFHILWLKKPIISKIYLSFIHTPIHYIKIYNSKRKWKLKLGLGGLISILSIIILNKNIDIIIDKKMGKLWWIFPIIPHIYLTNKINNFKINLKNLNKKKRFIINSPIYVI